jgi:type IV secretory pathway VirB3-like protein
MTKDLASYAIPIHKSLLEPDLVFGIGSTALLLILSVTILLSVLASLWFVLVGIAVLIIFRQICKSDPFLTEILLDTLSVRDTYQG